MKHAPVGNISKGEARIMGNNVVSTLSRRSFLAKSAATAGTIAGAGALLQACSTSAAGSGKTVLNVHYLTGELTPAYIADFEKANPNITVKLTEYDPLKVAAAIAAGNPPDFIRGAGISQTPNLAARGLMANLDSYFANSSVLKVSDLDPINDAWRFDTGSLTQGTGPHYGMTKDWSQDFTLWYDKRTFDAAGVAYPDTMTPISYDDLVALGEKLVVREGGKIKVYGLGIAIGFGTLHLMQMVAQQGGSIFNDKLDKADFTAPEVKKAFQWFVTAAQAHFTDGPLDPASDWEWPLLQANRISIVQRGFWFGGLFSDNATDQAIGSHMAYAPAPQFGPQRVSICVGAVGAWIPAQSKKKDAAWKLMEYFMGGKPAQDRAKSGFGNPALKSLVAQVPQTTPVEQQAFKTNEAEKAYLKILRFTPYASPDAIDAVLNSAFTATVQRQLTVDAALSQINASVNALLTQGKEQIG